ELCGVARKWRHTGGGLLPPCGGGWEGVLRQALMQERPPPAALRASTSPTRGGGTAALSVHYSHQFVAGLMFIASVSSSTRALMVILPFCIAQAEPTATIGRRWRSLATSSFAFSRKPRRLASSISTAASWISLSISGLL